MKKHIIVIVLLLVLGAALAYGQAVVHTWQVVDRGGGRSAAGALVLQSSIGQSAVQRMQYIDTGTVLESGYIPGVRFLSGSSLWLTVALEANWNMLSVPLVVGDERKAVLYPAAISAATPLLGEIAPGTVSKRTP